MARRFEFDSLPVVQTKAGKLRGYACDDVMVFKGVQYAQAKRFYAPVEVTPWEGVVEATSYGFVCPLMAQGPINGEMLVPHRYWPQNENCQNLNIWTPCTDASAKKPVLVWFHGGGFTEGSSIEQKAYNGANMSRSGDVVVVSVNHRLNILGFLDLSPFGEQYAGSANAGQADLVAALRWVKENIAAFGGDPDNVTIFGQSGGGMKVSALMQTPSADGLFHKGIVMSGVVGDLMPYPSGGGDEIVKALMSELNLDTVEGLETVPYYTLAAAYSKVSPALAMSGKYVGCMPLANDFYLGEGPKVGFTEHAKTIPLMVGTVFGEFAFAPLPFFKDELPPPAAKEVLEKRFGAQADALIAEFAKAYPDKHPLDLLTLDTLFRVPTKQFIHAKAAYSEAPTYSYLFALDFPYMHGKTAWHCSDIPFVFNNTCLAPVANIPEVSDRLEQQIFNSVIQFARTGNPSHAGLPEWSATTPEDEATMIFDRNCEVRHNFDDKLLQLHIDASPKFSLAAMMAAQADIQH